MKIYWYNFVLYIVLFNTFISNTFRLFQSFFFSHFALIEGHVEKLRSVVEKAYFNSRNFLPAIMEVMTLLKLFATNFFLVLCLISLLCFLLLAPSAYCFLCSGKYCLKFWTLLLPLTHLLHVYRYARVPVTHGMFLSSGSFLILLHWY